MKYLANNHTAAIIMVFSQSVVYKKEEIDRKTSNDLRAPKAACIMVRVIPYKSHKFLQTITHSLVLFLNLSDPSDA